jgi:hypothetical protein
MSPARLGATLTVLGAAAALLGLGWRIALPTYDRPRSTLNGVRAAGL